MAVNLLNVGSNERMDIDDFRHLANRQAQDGGRQLNAQFLTDPAKTRTWILDGFTLSNPSATQVQIDKGRAILSYRDGAEVLQGMLATEGDANKVQDVSTLADATYGVYIRFEYLEGDNESRIFWNSAGSGAEVAQTTPTRLLANWSMRLETSTPGAEWTKIGEVDVASNIVVATTGLRDLRELYFEGSVNYQVATFTAPSALSLGGEYTSGWSSDGGGVANDRNADRKTYGTADLQTSIAAIRQSLADIKGRGLKNWWDRDIGGMNIGFDADPVTGKLAVGDSNLNLELSGSNPVLTFDTNDRLTYTRSTNKFVFTVSTTTSTEISSAGIYTRWGISAGLGTTPTAGTVRVGDDNFLVDGSTITLPKVTFDTGGDYLQYDRASDSFDWSIGTVEEMSLSATGLIVTNEIASDTLAVNGADLTASSAGVEIGFGLNVGFAGTPVDDAIAVGDADFNIVMGVSSTPTINFENTGSKIQYSRGSNEFRWYVGATIEQVLTGTGLVVYDGLNVGFTTAPAADILAVGDANFNMNRTGVDPILTFDASTDGIQYDRSENIYQFKTGGTTRMQVDGDAQQVVVGNNPANAFLSNESLFVPGVVYATSFLSRAVGSSDFDFFEIDPTDSVGLGTSGVFHVQANVALTALSTAPTAGMSAAGLFVKNATSTAAESKIIVRTTPAAAEVARAFIWLDADSANVGSEDSTAYMLMSQDGGTYEGLLGLVGTSGEDPEGNTVSNTLANSVFLGSKDVANLQFGTNAATRMTIDSAGLVGVNNNNPTYRLDVYETGATYAAYFFSDGNLATNGGIAIQAGKDDGTGLTYYTFCMDGDGGVVGALQNNGGTFSVVDLSDVRAKTGVAPSKIDGLSIINAVDVVEFSYKRSPNIVHPAGFTAQQIEGILPSAVSAPKDGLKMISKTEFIPVLLKAVQELSAKVDALQAA